MGRWFVYLSPVAQNEAIVYIKFWPYYCVKINSFVFDYSYQDGVGK